MHAGGVDPPVVEIEERADGDREIERLVRPSRGPRGVHIRRGDVRRVVVHFVDEPEQRLVLIVEARRFEIREDRIDQGGIAKKFRRNCGVGLQSKRAVVALRGVRRDELAQSRAERRRAAQDGLRESGEMIRRRQIRKQVPDLRVFGPLLLHLLDERTVRPGLRVLFDAGQKHRFHRIHRGQEIDNGAGAVTTRRRRDHAISTRFAAGPTTNSA